MRPSRRIGPTHPRQVDRRYSAFLVFLVMWNARCTVHRARRTEDTHARTGGPTVLIAHASPVCARSHDTCRESKFRPLAQATANRRTFRVPRTFVHSPAPRRRASHAAPGRLSMRLGGRTRPSWRRSSLAVRLPARRFAGVGCSCPIQDPARLAPQWLGPAAAPSVWIPLFSFRPSQLCLDANRRAISEPRPVGVANSVIPFFNCFRGGPTGLPRPSRWPSAS